MPYIKAENRVKYQKVIDDAIVALSVDGKNTDMGDLNYVISSITWKLFDLNPRYRTANDLVGVLECVKQEFVRRKVNPYEDSKISENGDIQ